MSGLTSLNCPNCAGTLPKQAQWRMVACPWCGSMVTKHTRLVERADFRARYQRACAQAADSDLPILTLGTQSFYLSAPLHLGDTHDIFAARRIAPHRETVVLKLAHPRAAAHSGAPSAPGTHVAPGAHAAAEARILAHFQTLTQPGSNWHSRLLQHMAAQGQPADGPYAWATVLRTGPGWWGSLADVLQHSPHGIDPRHGVWIGRRILEWLIWLGGIGIAHRRMNPSHWLVHPRDHTMLPIGWARADVSAGHTHAGRMAISADVQAAGLILAQLLGGIDPATDRAGAFARVHHAAPRALAEVICALCDQPDKESTESWYRRFTQAARSGFGTPRYLHFDPTAAGGPPRL